MASICVWKAYVIEESGIVLSAVMFSCGLIRSFGNYFFTGFIKPVFLGITLNDRLNFAEQQLNVSCWSQTTVEADICSLFLNVAIKQNNSKQSTVYRETS